MALDSLAPGQSARVTAVAGEGELRRHLLDMGLIPGVVVTLQKVAPMGDPLQVRLRGYELTLRASEAAKVETGPVLSDEELASTAPSRPRPPREDYRTSAGHPGFGEQPGAPQEGKHSERDARPEDAKLTFALVGNQNCGKTTLFNQLTGANQHVGNFPGVTVDRKDGTIRNHPNATVTDLPGVYSLSPYSSEEIVTRDFLLDARPDGIINIVDATNIERNMYLTMQLMELGIPMVLALNMMDEVRANGGTVLVNELERELGIPVIPIAASKNEGVDELVEHALHVARFCEAPGRVDFCHADDEDQKAGALHQCIHATMHIVEPYAKKAGLPTRFAATKLIEGDAPVEAALAMPADKRAAIGQLIEAMERDSGLDREAALADMRFSFLEDLCARTVVRPQESREHKRSLAADKVLTGRFTGIPCFFALMALIFTLTFVGPGAWLSDGMSFLVDAATEGIAAGLEGAHVNPTVCSLVVDGVCAGVGSVLSFLPVIVTLFFCLSILEDTGYMARVAFIMDRALRRVGLSGRSIVPMLIGLGCTVPAVMSSRTLASDRDRVMTIRLLPFMSCSAKLPVYALIVSACFPREVQPLVMIGLYVFGIVCGVLYALLMKHAEAGSEPVPFVMELPNYRLPSGRSVAFLVWDKAKGFVKKAFTVIFLASIIVWFLQAFDAGLNLVDSPEHSLLALLAGAVAPIFAPLGFGDWRASTAIITGFIAKENVVSTLTQLTGGDVSGVAAFFTPITALSFLVFVLLYTPCVAAIATVRREAGAGAALHMVFVQCAIAWLVSFAVYRVGVVVSASWVPVGVPALVGVAALLALVAASLCPRSKRPRVRAAKGAQG